MYIYISIYRSIDYIYIDRSMYRCVFRTSTVVRTKAWAKPRSYDLCRYMDIHKKIHIYKYKHIFICTAIYRSIDPSIARTHLNRSANGSVGEAAVVRSLVDDHGVLHVVPSIRNHLNTYTDGLCITKYTSTRPKRAYPKEGLNGQTRVRNHLNTDTDMRNE